MAFEEIKKTMNTPEQTGEPGADLFLPYKRFGVFGPSESGKTTLSKKIAFHFFRAENRKSIVLDSIARSYWGDHAMVYTDEKKFWEDIFKQRDMLVVVDDGSVTINRDADLNRVFTTMRHQGHKLLVIGHGAENLLPQMRQQLQRVFLFSQGMKSKEDWEKVFPNKDLSELLTLQQFEFLTVANWKPVQKFKLTK
jgi:hypothetical protein